MDRSSRRYSGVPLVCDDCGRAAHSSVSGGRDGHTMLCDECRDVRGKEPRKTAARPDIPLAPKGTVRTATDDYPELEDILWSRPDLVESTSGTPVRVSLGAKRPKWDDPNRPDPIGDTLDDPRQPWWWRKIVGPAVDRVNKNLPPAYQTDDLSMTPSIDWCRFRRKSHCWYPEFLDEAGTAEAGYDVWIPQDRGICTRAKHSEQKKCPVGQPGPESGETTVYPDATISWSEGGQRRFKSYSSLDTTAKWEDVSEKARRIMKDGGVRIIANTGQTVTAEVRGDTGLYVCSITRVPGTKQIAISHCSCPWETYRWARSGRWKKYEGRSCAHITALLYQMSKDEMFGGDITEQTATPIWRTRQPDLENPKGQPGPWRLDRAASAGAIIDGLRLHLAGIGRAISIIQDESIPANVKTAKLAMAKALYEVAHTDLVAVEAGLEPLPGVVSSLKKVDPFQARVNGVMVTIVNVGDGHAITEGGSDFPARLVIHPKYHPTLGLTITPLGAKKADEPLMSMDEASVTGKYTHAGMVVKALDSGRVLMTQRTPYHNDGEETYGSWEFPGGLIDEGETPLRAAEREFIEETGLPLPEGFDYTGCYANDTYLGIVVVVPNEAWTTNAELLDRETMGIGWFEPDHIEEADFVRPEVAETTEWDGIKDASLKKSGRYRIAKDCVEIDCSHPMCDRLHHKMAQRDGRHVVQKGVWVVLNGSGQVVAQRYTRSEAEGERERLERLAILHDEPEPALPETYGSEDCDLPDPEVVVKEARTKRYEPSGHTPTTYPPFAANRRQQRTMVALAKKMLGTFNGPDSGFTYNWQGQTPTTGYQVAYPGMTFQIGGHKPTIEELKGLDPDVLAMHLDSWIRDRQKAFNDGKVHIGGWWSPQDGRIHLDPSQELDTDEDKAVAEGKKRNQQAIWNNATASSILSGGAGDADETSKKETNDADQGAVRRAAGRTGRSGVRPGPGGRTDGDALAGDHVVGGVQGPAGRRGHQRIGAGVGAAAGLDGADRGGVIAPGDTSLSWLMNDSGPADNDIAAAASEYLAKMALKSFSPEEQAEIIVEGEDEGVGASNLDRLEIEGTLYASLEDDDAEEASWLM